MPLLQTPTTRPVPGSHQHPLRTPPSDPPAHISHLISLSLLSFLLPGLSIPGSVPGAEEDARLSRLNISQEVQHLTDL